MSDAVLPHRAALVALNGLTAVAATAGAVQLVAGVATPPDSDLPWPLTGWTLPGLWLLLTVALPTGAAGGLPWRRAPSAPVHGGRGVAAQRSRAALSAYISASARASRVATLSPGR